MRATTVHIVHRDDHTYHIPMYYASSTTAQTRTVKVARHSQAKGRNCASSG